MFDKKECMKQWRAKNKDRLKEYDKKWRKANPEYKKIWNKNNPESISKSVKKWQEANPKYQKEYQKEYGILYRKNNKEHYRQWCKKKYNTDRKYKLNSIISRAIRRTLKDKKGDRKWENLVGYTLKDLIKRLEFTMPKDYTWQDFLDGKLHIDHIIPKSVFNYTKINHIDFKRCWALNNLRLLPAKENLVKGSKLTRPFQPALKI